MEYSLDLPICIAFAYNRNSRGYLQFFSQLFDVCMVINYDDDTTWKHFPHYLSEVRRIHLSPVDLTKGR